MGSPAAQAEASGAPLPAYADVAIVGAGFGGLGMAIGLLQRGVEDLVVLERGDDVGGTWRANTYPGAQCDVPSNLYSFSFAPNPGWTRSYPEQPQLLAYLRRCADEFGVRERTRFGCEVLEASWRPEEGRWVVETTLGTVAARVLVAASGLLSEPRLPDIPGLDAFGGSVFHTGRWDHDADLAGKRVALIGTGATAIQVGPRLHEVARRLVVFQRTPGWVLPHLDRPIPPVLRRAYARVPALQRLARAGVYALREELAAGMAHEPRLLAAQQLVARAWLRVNVRDRDLRAKLTPAYRFGCKRALLSNAWYPTLTSRDAELVTDPIDRVTERGVRTADGAEHEVDAIVLATGYTPTDPAIAHRLRRPDGRTLADVWAGSPSAYLGTAVHGFPDLFLLYGPNLNLGHSSIVYMLEAQVHYVVQAVELLRARPGAVMEVRAETQAAYTAELDAKLARTVWDSGGCSSWYLDATGRNSTMWPDFTWRFRRRVERLDPADYVVGEVTPAGSVPVPA